MSHMVNEGEANDNYINGDNSQENVPAFFIHANAMRSLCVLVNWPNSDQAAGFAAYLFSCSDSVCTSVSVNRFYF